MVGLGGKTGPGDNKAKETRGRRGGRGCSYGAPEEKKKRGGRGDLVKKVARKKGNRGAPSDGGGNRVARVRFRVGGKGEGKL